MASPKNGKRKGKSAHLQELEGIFEKRTRRFSAFEVLGVPPVSETQESMEPNMTRVMSDITRVRANTTQDVTDGTCDVSDMLRVGKVVEELNTTTKESMSNITQDRSDTTCVVSDTVSAIVEDGSESRLEIHERLEAAQHRGKLSQKDRQVLRYLNSLRQLDNPSYTVAVGYGQLSRQTDTHANHIRRNILPKLAMLGLIGVLRKGNEGTIYHLHRSVDFIEEVVSDDIDPLITLARTSPEPSTQQVPEHDQPAALFPWVDREQWGWLAPETIQQLVAKAGDEAHAKEILDVIIYNETHGPVEKLVRNCRAVLSHYLRTPEAEIWANDKEFETIAMRRNREQREAQEQAEVEAEALKARAERTLWLRQEAARVNFLADLSDTQRAWLKQEAKRLVDADPGSKLVTSRFPLYKAEEEHLTQEWFDRSEYGEVVPEAERDTEKR